MHTSTKSFFCLFSDSNSPLRVGRFSVLAVMKQKKFPIRVIRGGVTVRVFRHRSAKGYVSYVVSYYQGKRRERRTFSDQHAAEREANLIAAKLAQGEMDVLTLRHDDRLSYLRAVQALAPFGVSVDTAAVQYAQAEKLLNGEPLITAVQFFVKHHSALITDKTASEVLEELLRQKHEKRRSLVYIDDLQSRLGRFASAFKCPVRYITTQDIETFLHSLGRGGRTQNNYRRVITTLLKFATSRKYLPKDHPGTSEVDKATEEVRDIEVFSPEEMATLLTRANPKLVPYLCVAGFAGVRRAELERLDWEAVDFAQGHIAVKGGRAKVKVRRLVPLHENLRQGLLPYAKRNGRIVEYANLTSPLTRLAKRAGVRWQPNILRDSFISYRVAETQDVQRVALEAGNSPQMIFRNCLKVVPAAEAARWFSVAPAAAANGVPIARQAPSAG